MASTMIQAAAEADNRSLCLQKFRLYETFSHFYVVGRGKDKERWKVLKIDRLEPSELKFFEDSAIYSKKECSELLRRIHEGNRSVGGIKLLTVCYGIVGFIKFQEPYYMLLITERKKIGAIFGKNIYAISKSKLIPVSNPLVRSKKAYSRIENRSNFSSNAYITVQKNRYLKLFNAVDLTKDFFFSYSYHVMRSLQKNLSDYRTGQFLYETMFVWNEYLTRQIRKKLGNTVWTVALVYGFFKQSKLSVAGREIKFTLIARRSRHHAGTRYLRRGVTENGRVANEVETEQIVFEDNSEQEKIKISSAVQHRGSVPLFWSQEISQSEVFKPRIILRDQGDYRATKLHFKNLAYRYGSPIIILDLTKTSERTPRESILREAYRNAIDAINTENQLKFLQWDLHRQYRSKPKYVLGNLEEHAKDALDVVGVFYCQVATSSDGSNSHFEQLRRVVEEHSNKNACKLDKEAKASFENNNACEECCANIVKLQKGVLRSNCIDCLDRTNIAQFAYGLAALELQLQALDILNSQSIDLDNPLAKELMGVYDAMGDKLALQYGGSPAHNKIFSESQGQWRPAIEYHDLITTIRRFLSNTYTDSEKQNAIDVFLGNPPPQKRKIELDPDKPSGIRRSSLKRSFSDGNILWDSEAPMASEDDHKKEPLLGEGQGSITGLVALMPKVPPYIRYTSSEFPDVDWHSESERSDDEEVFERTTSTRYFDVDWYSESLYSEQDVYERFIRSIASDSNEAGSSRSLNDWINNGGTIFHSLENLFLSRR